MFGRVTYQSRRPIYSLVDADLIFFFFFLFSFFHLYAKSAKEQLSGAAALRDPNLSDTKWKYGACGRELLAPLRRGRGGLSGWMEGRHPGTSDGHVETSLRLVSDTDDEARCVITALGSERVESKQQRGT